MRKLIALGALAVIGLAVVAIVFPEKTKELYVASRAALGIPARPGDRAAQQLHLLAERGDRESQFKLANLYFYGQQRVPRDEPEGLKWFTAAADQGDPRAQYFLAWWQARSDVRDSQKDAEALRRMNSAVEQSYAPAQSMLADWYKDADMGLPRSDDNAQLLYKLAADQGFANAQASLGFMLTSGPAKNFPEAVRYLTLAAAQGHGEAAQILGRTYQFGNDSLAKDETEAVRFYRISANAGFRHGQTDLARAYLSGLDGLEPNRIEALRLLTMAAKQGDLYAKRLMLHLEDKSLSPSFDCVNANIPVERLICEDEMLSTLDQDLAKSYDARAAKTANLEGLFKNQQAWLKSRDEYCGIPIGGSPPSSEAAIMMRTCLSGRYRLRIMALNHPAVMQGMPDALPQ